MKNENIQDLKVWTSEMKRTKQTAQYIESPTEHWKTLNEIDAVSVLLILLLFIYVMVSNFTVDKIFV